MAPSRGLSSLLRIRIPIPPSKISRCYSEFVRQATNPKNKSQVYISRSLDPYLNLSIEHFLLQKTPADSTILFLYMNRPSVVIGRNQNPWTETNVNLIGPQTGLSVDLVRRRSGGGTVFHDEGNVNYSVICPSAVFNRDKHAEMVVRALQGLGVNDAKVNCRHDIVVDRILDDGRGIAKPLKVSGSAYKLTRLRSLHHGTCLLNSRNIGYISRVLKSAGKPFITARGVESVRSPITNVDLPNESFEQAVVSQFNTLYDGGKPVIVEDDLKGVLDIAKGFEELKSEDWTYCQTPQFTFSSKTLERDDQKNPALNTLGFPEGFKLDFTVRHGQITELDISYNGLTPTEESRIRNSLLNKHLHLISDWQQVLYPLHNPEAEPTEIHADIRLIRQPGIGLNRIFGQRNARLSK